MKLTILPLLMVTGVIIVPSKPSKIMAAVGKRQVGCPTSADRGQLVTAEMCISSYGQFTLQLSYLSMCAYEPESLDRAPTGSVGYTHQRPAGCKCQSLHVTGFVISYCMRIHQKNI